MKFIYLTRFVLFAIIFLFFPDNSMAQLRYRDSLFGDIRMRTFDYADTLKLDFYDSPTDTLSRKALIILVHGGGFAAGQRDGGEEVKFCTTFAQKGYTVASISYRLTMKNRDFGCDCTVEDKLEAYINAVDDLKKARYYLTSFSEDFKVHPDQIILAGSSSGAETVLNAVILKDHYLFKQVDEEEGKVIGIISMSGATLASHYLNPENVVPMLFFHGKLDDKVPFGIGSHHSCPTQSEGYLMLDGPLPISERLRTLDSSYQIFEDPEGTHKCADLAYRYLDIMTDFLYKVVLNKEQRQNVQQLAIQSNR